MYQSLFNKFKLVFILLGIICNVVPATAQTVSLGYPAVQDILRREQLKGSFNPNITFSNLPLEISSLTGTSFADSLKNLTYTPISGAGFDLSILSPYTRLEFQSHHPYPYNNGIILPAKGFSNVTSIGVAVRHKFLSIQFRPEFYSAQNKEYEGFPESHFDIIWGRRYNFWNRIDQPEQHGIGRKQVFDWGQSHAMITFDSYVGIGVSNENLWWGPGKRNTLLMSNNSRGFQHLVLKTLQPIKTPIGHFETSIVSGFLEGSGFAPPDTTRSTLRNSRFYVPKRDERRYLNAITFSYQPKWIKGLTLGGTRTFQMYWDFARETKSYLPIFFNLFRKNDEDRNEREIDQYLAFNGRWYWESGQAEIYFEFGRNDASFNFRDFLISPQHSRAYVIGFSKLLPLKNDYVEINYEHTELSQTINYIIRNAFGWYEHSLVAHGYTNRGEVLGASIGPGSDMDHITISYVKGFNKVGILFERLAHQQDFYYSAWDDINDFRRFWIDYSFGVNGYWQFDKILVDGTFIFTRSLNYQWEIEELDIGIFDDGRDVSNFSFNLSVGYLF